MASYSKVKYSKIENKYLFFASILAVSFALLPITRLLPEAIKASVIMLEFSLGIIGVLNILNKYKKSSKLKHITYFIVIVFVLIIDLMIYLGEYQYVPVFSFWSKFLMMFAFWLPFILVATYCTSFDVSAINIIKKVILFFLIVTAITTLAGSIFFDDASRILASGDTNGNRLYQAYNIGGYGFIYALSLTIPWLIYQYHTYHKKIVILILILFCGCIIKSSYTTAIIITLYSIIVSLIMIRTIKKKSKIKILLMTMPLIIIIMLCLNNQSFWVLLLKIVSSNSILLERVSNLQDLFIKQSMMGDIGFRTRLYLMSWNAFLNNPLTGNMSNHTVMKLGYHSEILDLLGGCGIIGFSILLIIICYLRKIIMPQYKNQSIKVYYMVTLLAFFVFCFINTVIGSLEFSIILSFLYLPEYKNG